MAIDTSGKWWKGQDFDDIAGYLRAYTEDDYPAEEIRQCVCTCGGRAFRLIADADEGCAQRACVACGSKAFICDSGEYWEGAEPKPVRCPCKGQEFEVAVGFSLRDDKQDVKWVTVAERCLKCGVLGAAADWKIAHSPSLQLIDAV
jgi:hypothetical protein